MSKIRLIIIGVFVLLIVGIVYLFSANKSLNTKYSNAINNVKSYQDLLSSSKKDARVFKMTIDQLQYSNDSLMNKIKDAQKSLGIKNSSVNSVGYIGSSLSKRDTLKLPGDTIFKNDLSLDTLIGDKWLSTRLILKYPGTIITKTSAKSELILFITSHKETINPPKKFFLFRLFQKKQLVLNATIKENNPYIINNEQRFIQIIK